MPKGRTEVYPERHEMVGRVSNERDQSAAVMPWRWCGKHQTVQAS